MINSIIQTQNIDQEKETFPLLARSTTDETVVLFTDNTIGTVVKQGGNNNNGNYLGYTSSCWVSCFNKEQWTLFEEGDSITLFQL